VQKIVTILLAFALYAPNVASLLAYSECELIAKLNNKPDCDCKLSSAPQQNNPTNLPDKHKEIVQQTDWKYIIKNSFENAVANETIAGKAFQQYQSPYYSLLIGNAVFHPPCSLLFFTA
jgi:hypothetical protein